MPRLVITAVAGLAALVSAGCRIDVNGGEAAVIHEQKQFQVQGGAEIDVKTFDGSIEVRSWDRDEVLVEIERRAANRAEAEALEVRATQEGSRVTVEARNPASSSDASPGTVVRLRTWQSPSVRLIVTTPRRVATLQATTGDGAIAAADVAGTIALHTGDGAVRAERLAGAITAHTGDGAMSLSDLQGSLDLNTGDGVVEVSGRFDTLRVNTGDGPVRVEARAGSAMKSDWTINTGDGAITLRLPSEFDAEVDAHTGDGPVTAAGLAGTAPTDPSERGLLRGRLGNGGQTLRLRTGDGPIAITR